MPDIRFFPALTKQDTPYRRARIASDVVSFVNEYAGTTVAIDYSFKQQHSGSAAETGTCEVKSPLSADPRIYDVDV